MGRFQGRSVVGAVACDRHHFVVGLKCLDKPFLVERTCSGNDFQVFDASAKLVVGHGGYFGTCGDLAAGVGGVVP